MQLHKLRSHLIPSTDQVALQQKSAAFSHQNFAVDVKRSHKSVYLLFLPNYTGERTSDFLIVPRICVSWHLVAVHETATWECDMSDIRKVYVR